MATYEEDVKSTFRLTKLTFSAVYPKPLQRQNSSLLCQVFNDKTVAAMRTLQQKLNISEGIQMIIQWYNMVSVKSKYIAGRHNDEYREKWTKDCKRFERLSKICETISTCIFNGARGRQRKLTMDTGNAFLITTKNNVLASKKLIESHGFEYVLSAIFSQNPIEKFFGQARQRVGGNFYIDIGDVIASAKINHFSTIVSSIRFKRALNHFSIWNISSNITFSL